MKITETEYDRICDEADKFMQRMDELGVSSLLLCFSCNLEDVGWISESVTAGDPRACEGLAWEHLQRGDMDDGVGIFFDPEDDGPDFAKG